VKPHFSHQRNQALTLVELIVVIGVLTIVAAFLLPLFEASSCSSCKKLSCVNNLKQIGLSFRMWGDDNNDKYPMQVSVTNGGAMELVATGNVAACFQVVSNILGDPKLLICPQDAKRTPATSFSRGFNNDNVSYFVGLDVTNETNPQMFLSGDGNFTVGGVPIKSGLLQLWTNTPVAWAKARHKFVGNILFADGSVRQLTTDELQQTLQRTGIATNRLAIP